MNRIKIKSIVISMIASWAILSSCDDNFLERYPLDRPSDAVYFKKSSDLEIYKHSSSRKNRLAMPGFALLTSSISTPTG